MRIGFLYVEKNEPIPPPLAGGLETGASCGTACGIALTENRGVIGPDSLFLSADKLYLLIGVIN